MKIYLAGKMGGLTFEEMDEWRREAAHKFFPYGIRVINPVRFYNFENEAELKASDEEIMEFDLMAVKNCDLVLVNLDFPDSIGTAIEMFEAKRNLRIPVIGFGTADRHPWMKACTSKQFNTMDEAIVYIEDFYGRMLG